MNDTGTGIVVAVGPDGIHDGALDFAALEALRRGTGVELLHIVHSLVTVPAPNEDLQAIDQSLTKVGRKVLTDAAARMRQRLDGKVPLSTEIVFGPIARTIAERGAQGQLIVVERRDIGPLERLLTMSISTGVAAHATVPVVVVPPDWVSTLVETLPVTVGVDRPMEAPAQVRAALRYARESGRALVVLHAAWLAEPYQDMVFAGYSRDQWVKDGTRELETALTELTELGEADGVDLTCDVRWTRPVDALVKATQRSSVVVLSRRDGSHAMGAHLGPVTRAVLHHAECPVMVADRK
jgi:nucleotide-binding universal stress UspA family protein